MAYGCNYDGPPPALPAKTLLANQIQRQFSTDASSEGHFQPNVILEDRALAQLIFAFRIFDHDVDISISTREGAEFRNNMLPLGITSLSAGSKTEPGGISLILRLWNNSTSVTNALLRKLPTVYVKKDTNRYGKTGTDGCNSTGITSPIPDK